MRRSVLLAIFLVSALSFSTDIMNCSLISAPGSYVLTDDLVGAPISGIYQSCIRITASDVTLDCAGYTITNNGTTNPPMGTAGIEIGSFTSNVMVKNCGGISSYDFA
jgi:hypothetical protein